MYMYSPSCTTFPLKPYRNIINVFKGPTANVKKHLSVSLMCILR